MAADGGDAEDAEEDDGADEGDQDVAAERVSGDGHVASTLDLSHLTVNKSLGVTFAAALLLDATIIRLILVPAMMRLLGGLNWWPATEWRS